MPQYHFLLRESGCETDCGLVDLPDAEAAFYQAFRSARDAMQGELFPCDQQIVVEDDERNPVWSIEIKDFAAYA